MKKKTTVIYIALIAVTALFLAVTLAIPDHGNGSGWEYGLWCVSTLYPLYYIGLGIVLGAFLPPKQICLNGAILYVITFFAFFLNYLISGSAMPDLVPFSLSCVLYPLGCTIAAALVWGCRELYRELRESHRLWQEKKNSTEN